MKIAESVTFGGSALDRAAELRGKDGQIAQALADGMASTIFLWRGKPLLAAPGLDRVLRLPMDHAVTAQATATPILLGRDAGGLIFVHDISCWQPAGLDDAGSDGFHDCSEQRHPDLPRDSAFVDLRQVMTRLDTRDAELAVTARAVTGWHGTHRFCARCGAESRMILDGWQRYCDACGGRHFPRTDPVVIMLITRGNSVLLGRSPGWPDGMYSLLAGFVEPGETIEAAVRREVFEETAVQVGAVGYLASQPWPFPASLMLGCHGEALSRGITLDPVEIEAAEWVTREDLMQAFAGAHDRIAPARNGSVAQFLMRNWLADRLD